MKINSHVNRGLSRIKCTDKSSYVYISARLNNWRTVLVPVYQAQDGKRFCLYVQLFGVDIPISRQLFSTEPFSGWPVTSQTKQSIHSLAGGKLLACPALHHLLISPKMCGSGSSTDPVVSFILFCYWLILLHSILNFDVWVKTQNRELWSVRTPWPVWDQLRFFWVCSLTMRNSPLHKSD